MKTLLAPLLLMLAGCQVARVHDDPTGRPCYPLQRDSEVDDHGQMYACVSRWEKGPPPH